MTSNRIVSATGDEAALAEGEEGARQASSRRSARAARPQTLPRFSAEHDSLYTPALGKRLVALVLRGNFRETAASACGVRRDTVHEWLRRGARGEEPFAELVRQIDAADGQAEANLLAKITDAADVDWKSAAWVLERTRKTRYAAESRLTVAADPTAHLSRAQVAAELRRRAAELEAEDDVPELPPGGSHEQ